MTKHSDQGEFGAPCFALMRAGSSAVQVEAPEGQASLKLSRRRIVTRREAGHKQSSHKHQSLTNQISEFSHRPDIAGITRAALRCVDA